MALLNLQVLPVERQRDALISGDWGLHPSLVWHFWPLALAIVLVLIVTLFYPPRGKKPPDDGDGPE
jgi:hypothetical protein